MLQRIRSEPRVNSGWAASILVGLMLCALPLWLWGVPLRWFFLKSDDFVYIAWSRSPADLHEHLFKPHNGHVVPLFLLETHALARVAGSLEVLPVVLASASYATLVLAMAATGHVVARETGRAACGLAAMAAVGLTSVLGPALLWYAAGQALAAGTMVIIMLAALQAWRARGSSGRLALSLLFVTAAPLLWSGGYAAGPVGMAYLWADGRRVCRRAAAILAAASLAEAALVWSIAGPAFAPASHLAARSFRDAVSIDAVVAHTAQAVCEALVLNNLGLDASTTAGQALVLCTLLAGLWSWSRRRPGSSGPGPWPRIHPLEAAGAALVVTTFGMIFASRGTDTTFENLRGLGWYDTMAELGTVLFVFGLCSRIQPSSSPLAGMAPPGRIEFLGVMLFTAVMLTLQVPRVERVIFEYDGMAAPVGPLSAREVLQRTPADLAAQAKAQRHALAALDRIERAARRGALGRAEVHKAIDRVSVPGMPTHLGDLEPAALLDVPGARIRPREPGDDRR
jgi:hypothetical protein